MPERQLPVRPNLEQLRRQAKELLQQVRSGDEAAVAMLRRHRPSVSIPAAAKLADAQHALARSYGVPGWLRLVQACRMIDSIWRDDAATVRAMIAWSPRLLHEDARGVTGNWGPPMSYAANLGRQEIVALLHRLGAADVQYAFDRACLQSQIQTARQLYALGGRPEPGAVMGPCETLSASGLAFVLELGAEIADAAGDRLPPLGLVLETYCRNPSGKHGCLDLLAEHGVRLPDTPTMAFHRGRLDLLAAHVKRDPGILDRRFSHREIFPPELGCHEDESLALLGTPAAGGTLLHLCVEYDELEMARWLIEEGADVNAAAEIDADGFGGHTPLFNCVVSQPYRTRLRQDDEFARLLLDHGADPNARASLRKQIRFEGDELLHEYPDVTPLTWGERFHGRAWVSPAVMGLIAERGGQR